MLSDSYGMRPASGKLVTLETMGAGALPNLRKDALCKSHFSLLSRRAGWQGSQTVEKVRNSWNSSFLMQKKCLSARWV